MIPARSTRRASKLLNKAASGKPIRPPGSGGLFRLKSMDYWRSLTAWVEFYVALQDFLCCHANK
jgi:hypothetical protein